MWVRVGMGLAPQLLAGGAGGQFGVQDPFFALQLVGERLDLLAIAPGP